MKKNLLVTGIGFLLIGASIMSACTKEGPMGPAGADGKDGTNGTNGTNGTDGTATCIQCHAPAVVELAATQYEFSKHSYGEAAFEEAGNTGCTPCHTSDAFLYVTKNNVPVEFVKNATTNKWSNPYATVATATLGEITCVTCHSSLHTTYTTADLPALTTVAAVKMTMWGGAQTIDLPADNHQSNLCVKCHQPRPFTNSATNGNVLNYDSLKNFPTVAFYDPTRSVNVLKPGYRTHTHYGTAGAVYAGKGGVEFAGTETYANSPHTAVASCQDCHMATQTNRVGGHTFFATGNVAGCNQTGCHTGVTTSGTYYKGVQDATKALLDQLAAKLKVGGVDILNRNPDTESNLWASKTTNKYDGYLNIYDPINNPNGQTNNPGGMFQSPSPSNSWSQAQKDYNLTLPKITLTNAQMGAIINFQLCLRDYSLGIHNTKYTQALLKNTIAILP